jgi:hypothetical protein
MTESPPDRLPARNALGVLLFIVGCLLSTVYLIYMSPNPAHWRMDDIAQRSGHRFTALRAELPARGVIGYIGEPGNAGTEDYYLAQYSLAPLVVDRSLNHLLVIGSFPDSRPVLPTNLQVVRDFGNGVLLIANKDAK